MRLQTGFPLLLCPNLKFFVRHGRSVRHVGQRVVFAPVVTMSFDQNLSHQTTSLYTRICACIQCVRLQTLLHVYEHTSTSHNKFVYAHVRVYTMCSSTNNIARIQTQRDIITTSLCTRVCVCIRDVCVCAILCVYTHGNKPVRVHVYEQYCTYTNKSYACNIARIRAIISEKYLILNDVSWLDELNACVLKPLM